MDVATDPTEPFEARRRRRTVALDPVLSQQWIEEILGLSHIRGGSHSYVSSAPVARPADLSTFDAVVLDDAPHQIIAPSTRSQFLVRNPVVLSM